MKRFYLTIVLLLSQVVNDERVHAQDLDYVDETDTYLAELNDAVNKPFSELQPPCQRYSILQCGPFRCHRFFFSLWFNVIGTKYTFECYRCDRIVKHKWVITNCSRFKFDVDESEYSEKYSV